MYLKAVRYCLFVSDGPCIADEKEVYEYMCTCIHLSMKIYVYILIYIYGYVRYCLFLSDGPCIADEKEVCIRLCIFIYVSMYIYMHVNMVIYTDIFKWINMFFVAYFCLIDPAFLMRKRYVWEYASFLKISVHVQMYTFACIYICMYTW
jgi:hypothetical protein